MRIRRVPPVPPTVTVKLAIKLVSVPPHRVFIPATWPPLATSILVGTASILTFLPPISLPLALNIISICGIFSVYCQFSFGFYLYYSG